MNDRILKAYEDIALSNFDITALLNDKVNIVLYPDLHKYQDIDQVLGRYGACILLFEAKPNYGHWCAIFKRTYDTLEFFNPYGGYPDDSLGYIPYHFALVSNQLIPYLSLLMLKSQYKLTYNEFRFQKHKAGVKTCGRHCVFRLLNRDLSLYKYKSLLDRLRKHYKTDYDGIVTILTSQ